MLRTLIIFACSLIINTPIVFAESPSPASASSQEKGWQGLAKLLDTISPSVDTELAPSAAQVTSRITQLIDNGHYDAALQAIAERKKQRANEHAIGDDVQLLFLEGRALAAKGEHNKAIDHYRDMTTRFPELPEPWNNLASEYARLGQFDRAEHALQTALSSNPHYAQARFNLGLIQLMQAQHSFLQAHQAGAAKGKVLAEQTQRILQSQ